MTTCDRCGIEIEDHEHYCENCYDHLFVSWEEAYQKMLDSAEVIIKKGKSNDRLEK